MLGLGLASKWSGWVGGLDLAIEGLSEFAPVRASSAEVLSLATWGLWWLFGETRIDA